jgi:membrane associated rhomboid family serine protease
MRSIDRFCARHPRFGIPNLMLFIIIGNAIVWVFTQMDTTHTLAGFLAFSPYHILHGQIWRIITFALVPDYSSLLSLVISLYFYYFIGSALENQWGAGKFTVYYFTGLLCTIVYGFIVYFITGVSYSISTSYINLSMFFSFATLFPETRVLLFFFIPVKIKWLAYIDAAFFVLEVLVSPFPANLLPVVAILNYLLFCGGWLFDIIRPANIRNKRRTVNFKREAKRVNRERARAPYNYRCELCGRTDADYPDLEFRYCSRCAGYHCYCIDHINNHIHFSE